MLGHLKPTTCNLSSSAFQDYQQFYCGICASLRKEKGLGASLMINHELSLNLLALAPFIQNMSVEKTACPAKVFTQSNRIFQHSTVQLASRLSILLGWLKSKDWAFDSKSKVASLLEKKLNTWNQQLNSTLSPALQQVITDYVQIIQTTQPTTQAVESSSGALAQALWHELSEQSTIPVDLKQQFTRLFEQAGKIIFQADAIEDYFTDVAKGLYNPIVSLQKEKGYSLHKAATTFYHKYTLRKYVLLALNQSIQKVSPESKNFTEVFASSIQQMDVSTEKHIAKILEGTEPNTFQELLASFQSFDFTSSQCCDNCCNNCKCNKCDCNCPKCECPKCNCPKCECPKCDCNCPKCDCNCPKCECPKCDCNCPKCDCGSCDCKNNCNCCEGGSCCEGDCCHGDCCCSGDGCCAPSQPPSTYDEEFNKEFLKEINESDLPDSVKNKMLDLLDSLHKRDKAIDDVLREMDKDD